MSQDIVCTSCHQPVPPVETKPFETMEDFVREYARLDSVATQLEEAMKEANKKRDAVEQQIIERFNMEGMTSTKIAGLGTFSMTTMTRASIKADQKEQAILRFKSHYPDMVQETINAQTLSGFVNNSKKNGIDLPVEIVEVINIFQKQHLSWRR